MLNNLSGESFFFGFGTEGIKESEVNDEGQTEFFTTPPETEKPFVETARNLSCYEYSLGTLAKRFYKDGIQTGSKKYSEATEKFQNSHAFAGNAIGKTDLLAGGDSLEILAKRFNKDRIQTYSQNYSETTKMFRNSDDFADNVFERTVLLPGSDNLASRTKRQTSNGRQKYVKIPIRTAEMILRIIDKDLDKNQRSLLKQAEFFLNRERLNLIVVKKLLQRHLKSSGRSLEPILMKANEIIYDMSTIIDKLDEKLVENREQILSELLVRSLKNEARLPMLAKRLQARNDGETVNIKSLVESHMPSRSKACYAIIFCCVVIYFVERLVRPYLGQDKMVPENVCLYEWQAISRAFF